MRKEKEDKEEELLARDKGGSSCGPGALGSELAGWLG